VNFQLTEEQEAIRAAVHELAQREFAPKAATYDRTGEFPWDNVRALAQNGYFGMQLPPEVGGAGCDYLSYAIALEEVARACATTAVIFDVQNSLHIDAIWNAGNEEQKRTFLPPLCRGEVLGAYCLTEPHAGSDAASIRTRAHRVEGGYRLNGRKVFVTNGGVADRYIVYAVTDPDKGPRGISAFIVDKTMPGVSFGQPLEKLGIRASATCDVVLEDVFVPTERRLGEEGEGYRIALQTLHGGRIGIASQALGILQAAIDCAAAYALEREQFGRPIAEFEAIQWMLAEMEMNAQAARLLVYRAAWLHGQGIRATAEISQAKLFASTAAMKGTVMAVQILGGYGYTAEYPVERYMRDAKITEIYEGTSEVQKMVIARELLKRYMKER
jgi:butyryl-CoA dehydrogenase